MNPSLEIFPPVSFSVYSNISFSCNVAFIGYPTTYNVYTSALTTALPITISGKRISGKIGNSGTAQLDVTATTSPAGVILSNTATLTFTALADAITFSSLSPVYTLTQNVPYSLTYLASARSGQPLTYYTQPHFDGPVGLTINPSTGFISGIPRGISTVSNYRIYATTPQGETNSVAFTISMIPDVVTISAAYGLANYCYPSTKRFPLIQNRKIDLAEYPGIITNFESIVRSGDKHVDYFGISFPSGVILDEFGNLAGTPLVSGSVDGTIIAATSNGIRSTLSLQFDIAPDLFVITSPTTLDFIAYVGETASYTIIGHALSGSKIVGYGVNETIPSSPPNITITSGGELTINTTRTQRTIKTFVITATTIDGQVIRSRPASYTVNSSGIFRYISPNGSSVLLPENSSYPIITEPNGYTFSTVFSDFIVTGSNIIRSTAQTIYPPSLVSIRKTPLVALEYLNASFRIFTETVIPFVVDGPPVNRWVQYVPINLTLSANQPGPKVFFSVPNPPNGVSWNPINNTLAHAANTLTIEDSFMAYASDGYTTTPIRINYSVRAPIYLRIFSAPSAYTNYVKQTAFIKAAVHAIDNTAFLPDALVTTQTGPYPEDQTKDVICRTPK